MDKNSWLQLQINWEEIVTQKSYKAISDLLFELKVLEPHDLERLQTVQVPRDRMEELLLLLKKKPSSCNAFRNLMDALRDKDVGGSEWLADKIENTPIDIEAGNLLMKDPMTTKGNVRNILIKNFKWQNGAETTLEEIDKALNNNGAYTTPEQSIPWSLKHLGDFVTEVFAGVVVNRKQTRRKMKTNTFLVAKNLGKCVLTNQQTDTLQSNAQCSGFTPNIANLTCSELRQFLEPKLAAEGISLKILSDLETNEISGKVFLDLKEDDLKDVFPSASFGARRSVQMLIHELAKQDIPKVDQSKILLRKFDSVVDPHLQYHVGRCCDTTSGVNDKTTRPVRLFELVDSETSRDDRLRSIATLVVAFASACFNHIRNGTLYFGISPEDGNNKRCGEIIGTALQRDKIQDKISRYLEQSFLQTQIHLVKTMVRDARFIPVMENTSKGRMQFRSAEGAMWVVEVDVKVSPDILGDKKIITLLHKLPLDGKKGAAEGMFEFSDEGYPVLMSPEKRMNFESARPTILEQRKQEEADRRAPPAENLRAKLLNLLTGGCDVMQDSVCTFMMVNSIGNNMDQEYLSENMPFVKNLDAELIMDFGTQGFSNGLHHNLEERQEDSMRVLTTDNFDLRLHKKEEIETLKKDLNLESRTVWMFCNGYQPMNIEQAISQYDWKKKRRSGFQKGLEYYIESFGSDRIILIICLFSQDYEIMLDACEEAILKLDEGGRSAHWMVIAESKNVVHEWSDQMLKRNCVAVEDLNQRLVVGMSWAEVNATIMQATNRVPPQTYLLPTSSHALIEIREKKLKDWSDIEVVSASDDYFVQYADARARKEAEEKFYQGGQVRWMNFWYEDQVLQRDIHNGLKQKVQNVLEGMSTDVEDSPTAVVSILHQPGAGGTTSARHILWDMRKLFRCCAVRSINDSTADQIDEIHSYKDKNPKPVLILVDNEDEEKYVHLRGDLEERGRKLWRSPDADEANQLYCVILLCIRRTSLPVQLRTDEIVLRQELTALEFQRFDTKSKKLASGFKKNEKANMDPKFLISFNIMKENFEEKYIKNVVKEFTDDVVKPREVELLKFISFFNTYDPFFKPVRVSCLDIFLHDGVYSSNQKTYNRRPLQWEAELSQAVKVLLNLSTNKDTGRNPRTTVRVFNRIIAKEILENVKTREEVTDSDLMKSVLDSDVFYMGSRDASDMKSLINNIFKKREVLEDGKKKHPFSTFILQVKEREGTENAVSILAALFDKNKDPFTAQAISRFYSKYLKNWQKAESFARKAIDLNPRNSFLWDTYGQVFKEQLRDKYENSVDAIGPDGAREAIGLFKKCMHAFKNAQEVSEGEMTTTEKNLAGYFGELHSIITLLEALKGLSCFSESDDFYKLLNDKGQSEKVSQFLDPGDIESLKELASFSQETTRKLDDYFLQMKGLMSDDAATVTLVDQNRNQLVDIRVKLDEFFCSPEQTCESASEEENLRYRSQKAQRLGGHSLTQILSLRSSKMKQVHEIYRLMDKNTSSSHSTFDDVRTVLDAATVLLVERVVTRDMTFTKILDWSQRLYTQFKSRKTYLEPFLYFSMYNFPTEERSHYSLCPFADLQQSIQDWHKAFLQKYKRNRHEEQRQRATTIFFLGNGRPPVDIVLQDSLKQHMKHASRQDKWQLPEVVKKLRVLRGVLLKNGDMIKTQIKNREGNVFSLEIHTASTIRKRYLWQKPVYFYLGFSFSGPKAFGINPEKPRTINTNTD